MPLNVPTRRILAGALAATAIAAAGLVSSAGPASALPPVTIPTGPVLPPIVFAPSISISTGSGDADADWTLSGKNFPYPAVAGSHPHVYVDGAFVGLASAAADGDISIALGKFPAGLHKATVTDYDGSATLKKNFDVDPVAAPTTTAPPTTAPPTTAPATTAAPPVTAAANRTGDNATASVDDSVAIAGAEPADVPGVGADPASSAGEADSIWLIVGVVLVLAAIAAAMAHLYSLRRKRGDRSRDSEPFPTFDDNASTGGVHRIGDASPTRVALIAGETASPAQQADMPAEVFQTIVQGPPV